MPQSLAVRGVRSGFDLDDIRQESAIGALLAERRKPGDRWTAFSQARVRVARYRKKEAKWNSLRISIQEFHKPVEGIRFEQILIHEILDLLPYSMRNKVLYALKVADGRRLNKMGRLIREMLPRLSKENQP